MQKSVLELSRGIPIFTLKKLCLIRFSTIFCNIQQLLGCITKCFFYETLYLKLHIRKSKEWIAVQEKANDVIRQICQKDLFQKMIMALLWPVSYKIVLWKYIYMKTMSNGYLGHIYWTGRGRIDSIRTAKCIIANQDIYISGRFRLACSLCLSKEIHELWRKMPKEIKKYFSGSSENKLTLFWVHTVKGSKNVVQKYMQGALQITIKDGLFEANKYLFSVLDGDEKYHILKNDMTTFCLSQLIRKVKLLAFLEEDEIEIAKFLLSRNEYIEENREAINSHNGLVSLSILLYSSDHESFLEVLQKEFEFFDESDIEKLLRMIFNMYHLKVIRDNDYNTLFVKVWKAIPASAKKYVEKESYLGKYSVSVLIRFDFPFLLNAGAFEKMAKLTSHFKFDTSDTRLSYRQVKWEFLHFLIEERVATKRSLKNWFGFYIHFNEFIVERVFKFVHKGEGKKPITITID